MEYEGEYLYGKKWNGKGYDENGNIIYELINGNGKVKEYYDNGNLAFEGTYLNGKRNGKGKEYWIDGELEFEGEYLNGNRKGKEYNDNLEFQDEKRIKKNRFITKTKQNCSKKVGNISLIWRYFSLAQLIVAIIVLLAASIYLIYLN